MPLPIYDGAKGIRIDADRLVDLMTGIKSLNITKKGPAAKHGLIYVDLMIVKEQRDKYEALEEDEDWRIAGYRILHDEIKYIEETKPKRKQSKLKVHASVEGLTDIIKTLKDREVRAECFNSYRDDDESTDFIKTLKDREVRAECFNSYRDDDESTDFVRWDELSKYLRLYTLEVVSTKVPLTVNAKLKKIAEDQGTTPSLMMRELLEEKLSEVLKDKALEILYS